MDSAVNLRKAEPQQGKPSILHSISETEFEKVPFAENRTILGANLARPTFFGFFLGEINNIEITFAVIEYNCSRPVIRDNACE